MDRENGRTALTATELKQHLECTSYAANNEVVVTKNGER